MSDDYLWDPKAKPDPDVERLERALGALRYVERPALAEAPRPIAITQARRRRVTFSRVLLLAAALGALGAAGVWAFGTRTPLPIAVLPVPEAGPAPEVGPRLAVERLEGAPRVGAAKLDAQGALSVGQWLETDDRSRAKIAIADLGEVEVRQGSRVRLTATGPEQHRLDLERGAISAQVLAPPRLFVVGTPAAAAVDLGCAYTLEVDDQGGGVLHVRSGWVALEDGKRSALVPAGATCRTKKGVGPGTPSFDDAAAGLREALGRFDFEGGGAAAVEVVLSFSRRRDALTLWHLVSRVEGALRKKVVGKLRAVAPPPAGVSEADVMKLDQPALERWKDDFSVTW